jgi:hypothetical protein
VNKDNADGETTVERSGHAHENIKKKKKKKLQEKGSCKNRYESSHPTNGGELFISKDFIL